MPGACLEVLGAKQAKWGSSQALLIALPSSPSFITFRSCAYLDKKHTIFGR